MSPLIHKLRQAFRDKDYRHGYVDEFLNMTIATQVKVLREQRGWTQKELAERAQMRQPRISALENVNYRRWSIDTLRRLAEAFDVTLCVSFETFGKRTENIRQISRKALERDSFEDDPVFKKPNNLEFDSKSQALSRVNEDAVNSNVIPITPRLGEASCSNDREYLPINKRSASRILAD